MSDDACTLDEGAYILEEGAFACGGAHSWREGASSKGRELTIGGFYLVERRRTSWEMEGAWQGRNHHLVEFCMRRGRT